jgi:glutamate dehydrogenase
MEPGVQRIWDPSPTIDAVCRVIETEVAPDECPVAVRFARIFLSKAPPSLLRERSADDLTHMALGAFRFLGAPCGEAPKVAVFNPEVGEEGWFAPVTVVRTNISERPFVVDTIREHLHARGLAIEGIVYPLMHVQRGADGRAVDVQSARDGDRRESVVHCEVSLLEDEESREILAAELTEHLHDVIRATDDFGAMVDAVNDVVVQLADSARKLPDHAAEIAEVQDFLRWLRDGGFVFLGYRGYDLVDIAEAGRGIQVERGSGLGVLGEEAESTFSEAVPLSELRGAHRELAERGPLLIINKTNAESTVHRRARMDYVGVKKLGADGSVLGEHRFVGLFTSQAYAENAANIPILRQKLAGILEGSGVGEGTHDYKEIITIFNSLPKEELFITSAEEIDDDVRTVLQSYHTAGVRVTLRRDPLQRGVAVMIIVPRDRFSGDVRRTVEAALVEIFQGDVLNYHLALGEGDQARLHFYVAADESRLDDTTAADIEAVVTRTIRTWSDRIRESLERTLPREEASRLARRYGAGFNGEYQAATAPEIAVEDILHLEDMRASGREISISMANRGTSVAAPGVEGVTDFKVFLEGDRLILSDFMPILENTGLRVIAVNSFEIRGLGDESTTLYAFAVQGGDARPLKTERCGDLLAEAILAVRAGDAVNDSLNGLVVAAGLHWREVDVLRAYVGYAFQIGAVPSRQSLPSALVRYPGLARELFDLFRTRFDPALGATTEERTDAARDIHEAVQSSLDGVTALADDRALRRLQELIDATVRTGYYRHGGSEPTRRSGGVPYLSLKFACEQLDILSRTRLLFEVWVHSARMEGVHLRGADVARGGIRWSDRPDDFRTEILGLVRTQVVKNAVIVPSGSKGGFVTRLSPTDPDARFQEAKEQYQTLIRGLLDITDNLEADGGVVRPPDVICFDDPDPYLVVAADKGTATFSDVANGVSAEYGFWLGDAFASGGSNGYDHKSVGITARGAWECVKRHFREMGKDIQRQPFTVVGIGDMSGDVFGNGMLLSEQIRLLAAFDHRHVFIDPDPDEATSYEERQRMFAMGRSSWDDYDRTVLSEGAMIVPRAAKEVELTPQACAALGLDPASESVMSGEALVRAVLRAPAELLWNGGIGTYVRSDEENDSDAGDPANDAVRVSVSELRCRVVGEGGNLGFTQRARIAYGLSGGRVNTDALDNSAGVDMSDHEVNLKILLGPAVGAGSLSEGGRNALLGDLTDEVADLVLENNRTQSLAISLDEIRAQESADDFRYLMTGLEHAGELDRLAETLPTWDALAERKDRGQTLARPELCVLLAYAKLNTKANLLRGPLPDDPSAEGYLAEYFPARALDAAGTSGLEGHRLRREIIATQLTNEIVDLMGSTFANRLARDTGRSLQEVVGSWLVASRLADHRSLLASMAEQQTAGNSRVAYRWLLGLARVLERTTRWVLQNVDAETSPTRLIEQNAAGLDVLRRGFGEIAAGEDRKLFDARVGEIQELGADEDFSRNLITLRFLDQLLEILDIARETGTREMDAGSAYYRISADIGVPWLRRITFASAGDDEWEQRAAQVLSDDLSRAHRKLVRAAIRLLEEGGDVEAATSALAESHARRFERFRGIVAELRAEDAVSLAAISVAVRELADLAERASRPRRSPGGSGSATGPSPS